MSDYLDAGPRMKELLRKAGSDDLAVASRAMTELAKALEIPLNQGAMHGDITFDIFAREKVEYGVAAEYPIDFLTPGTEGDYSAYTIPSQGRIPERSISGDYLMVPTYEVGNSIDFKLRYAKECRWPMVARAMQVLESGFVLKKNTDAWRVIVSAGYGRSLTVFDDMAAPGMMSKRLVELMKTVMRRNAGGNSTSVNRGKLSRLYVSPEALGDIRTWNLDEIDDVTRREILVSPDLDSMSLFGVQIRSIDELGVGQEFQQYALNRLGYSLQTPTTGEYAATKPYNGQAKTELVIGLDLTQSDAFMNPVRQDVQVFEDPTFHRQNRASFYARTEYGFACLRAARVLFGNI